MTTTDGSRRRFCKAALGAGALLLPAHTARAAVDRPGGQALPALAAPRRLDVVDLERCSPDDRVLLSTLQGVTSRRRPQIYLSGVFEEGRDTWLREVGVPHTTVPGLDSLVRKYRSDLAGAIVPDPALPATRNVATTLAGLRDAVVASAATAARLGLPVLDDLRGRFASSYAAYAWAARNLWPDCTHRMLVALDPVKNLENLRDYAVANRAFVLWADPTRSQEADLLRSLMDDMPVNSPYLGWWPNDQETTGTELASRHGLYVAATDYVNNLTVFAGTPREHVTQRTVAVPTLRNRIHVTFTLTEGDNLQYNQHHMRKLWADPQRGRTPLNWSISPLAVDVAPAFLTYYQRTATGNDLLVAGPSGLGYAYPDAWPREHLSDFTRQTGDYLEHAGLSAVCVLNRVNGKDRDLSAQTVAAYARDAAPLGIWQNWADHFGTAVVSGIPLSTGRLVTSKGEAQKALAKAAQSWNRRTPLFLTIGVLAWKLGPSDVTDIARGLDDRFVITRGDHFFRLIRQSLPAGGGQPSYR
ncbi:GxGYxYP domain-containing protein [Streptomyces olivoreticuli]|uniref:GxGYxYP domain-containing protein n=1 Tax=Streptomyces olivoreticuli TaxID=68246 RepID=UPI000E229B55|nr:GxGYxYP domain-containing protein [Streptomyces olivoreticuli]